MARKILLADDSVTAQNMGRKILADAGYEVITVNNGSAALKRIAETKPDVIVLDVYMPGYSGLEVCQRLKESNDTARIPILLTVGKLEPFKPEEAKRVRAEGFIVKPFEASELLSALTKLEDKIVPRSDASKPGRFARAIAAVEEGRYDKSVSFEEDSGWKNRISFPRKKKEKPVEPEDHDDPAIYNAVNRDLKTVVENKPGQAPQPVAPPSQAPVAEEANVDLGALVAHGLPKDVTAEEIAALAAAAAQVQGVTENAGSGSSNVPTGAGPEVRAGEANKPAESSSSPAESRPSEVKAEVKAEETRIESAPARGTEPTAQMTVAAPHDARVEEAAKLDSHETAAEAASTAERSPAESAATFALEKLEQKQEAGPESNREPADDEDPISALAQSLPPMASFSAAEAAADSGNGGSANAFSPIAEPEPMTMAVAAPQLPSPSRWTAVAVALAPEETSVALEEEMRGAQAAAMPASLPAPVLVSSEDRAIESPAESGSAGPVTNPAIAPADASDGNPAEPPVVAGEQTPVATTSPAPVVKEFETVAPREPEFSPAAETPVESASTVTASAEPVEISPPVSTVADAPPDNGATNMAPASITSDAEPEVASSLVNSLVNNETPAAEDEAVPFGATASAAERETPADQRPPETAASTTFSEPEPGIPQASDEPTIIAATQGSGGPRDVAKKESEIAATTAAAWASWRRIRETADGKFVESAAGPESEERDEAAMAVAAGAEKAPQDSPDAEAAPEIASIVDSVLADLRPKIVEEISKKLGKKK